MTLNVVGDDQGIVTTNGIRQRCKKQQIWQIYLCYDDDNDDDDNDYDEDLSI